jgi:hypothetical protein
MGGVIFKLTPQDSNVCLEMGHLSLQGVDIVYRSWLIIACLRGGKMFAWEAVPMQDLSSLGLPP